MSESKFPTIAPNMRVSQPDWREVVFDCPWTGHLADPNFTLRNSNAPNVIGHRCLKCGALIYRILEESQIVGADGEPLAKA